MNRSCRNYGLSCFCRLADQQWHNELHTLGIHQQCQQCILSACFSLGSLVCTPQLLQLPFLLELTGLQSCASENGRSWHPGGTVAFFPRTVAAVGRLTRDITFSARVVATWPCIPLTFLRHSRRTRTLHFDRTFLSLNRRLYGPYTHDRLQRPRPRKYTFHGRYPLDHVFSIFSSCPVEVTFSALDPRRGFPPSHRRKNVSLREYGIRRQATLRAGMMY